MEPTAPIPPLTIQTRTQSALQRGIPRRRFSHFGYPSESESDQEPTEQPITEAQQLMVFPDIDDLEPLFSDQEEILPEPPSLIPSPSGTSAPLLSNPALTDTLSNFPLFGSQNGGSRRPEPDEEVEPREETDREQQEPNRDAIVSPTPGRTANRRGRPRGRPPGRTRRGTTSTSKASIRADRPNPRSRRLSGTTAQSQALERAMTLPNIAESRSPQTQDTQSPTPPQVPRYQLRRNRAPRYMCGTCGSRNCSCVDLIQVKSPDNRLARGVHAPTATLADTDTSEDHDQHTICTIQTETQNVPQVHHVVITMEKTYSSVTPDIIPPLETTLKAMRETSPSDCPTYRFKEWTRHDKSGLEFTLTAIIPPLPPSMVFGDIAPEDTNIAMILHHRAKTMGTIRRDLPARRCVPPNSGLLATSHLLRRDITSDARNPPNLSRKPTYPSGIRRHTLLPLSRHLPREISQPTLVATNSHHLLSPGQNTPIGQVHICI